jgi:hypothetical protein
VSKKIPIFVQNSWCMSYEVTNNISDKERAEQCWSKNMAQTFTAIGVEGCFSQVFYGHLFS